MNKAFEAFIRLRYGRLLQVKDSATYVRNMLPLHRRRSVNLEWVRENIRTALADIYVTGNGQLGKLAERARGETSRFNRTSPRFIDIGEKRVKRHSVPLKIKQTRAKGTSIALMDETDYAFVSWRRAINSLDEPLQAWGRYCYGDCRYRNEQFKVIPHIWERFMAGQTGRISGKVKQRLQGLAWLAVQVVASEIKGGFPLDYTYAELAGMLGVTEDNMRMRYNDYWYALKQEVTAYDCLTLNQLHQARRKIIEIKKITCKCSVLVYNLSIN